MPLQFGGRQRQLPSPSGHQSSTRNALVVASYEEVDAALFAGQEVELCCLPKAVDDAQPTRQWVPSGTNLGHHPSLMNAAKDAAP
jgi:hypothetical protein